MIPGKKIFLSVVTILFTCLLLHAADTNITTYGAVGDGKTLNTVFIQKAIDANATVIKVEVKGNVEAVSTKPKDKMKAGELD